jgi:hypothetical protein
MSTLSELADARVEGSPARGVPALASQLNLLSFLLAVFAAVFSVGPAFFDHAFARRVSALRLFGHRGTSGSSYASDFG